MEGKLTGLCECGCGRPAPLATYTNRRTGVTKGTPTRFIKGHNRRKPGSWTNYAEEDRGYTTTCWVWRGRLDRDGYGAMGGGKRAYRVFFEMHVGAIPIGFELDHLCRVRECVNPAHLEPVTKAENTRRGIQPASLKEFCKHGHPFDEANTYWRPTGQRDCRTCTAIRQRAYVARKARAA